MKYEQATRLFVQTYKQGKFGKFNFPKLKPFRSRQTESTLLIIPLIPSI